MTRDGLTHPILPAVNLAPVRCLPHPALDARRNIMAESPKPDLVIYLSPRLDVLSTRVIDVGHRQFIADNLQRQVVLYEEWFRRQTGQRSESIIRLAKGNARELFKLAAGHHCAFFPKQAKDFSVVFRYGNAYLSYRF
jgi:hypothetical protein